MTFDLVIVWYAVQQRWRYILLAVGVVSLFSAPFVSEWVPFYYTSSMAIGVLAVVLILLFQVHISLLLTVKLSFIIV